MDWATFVDKDHWLMLLMQAIAILGIMWVWLHRAYSQNEKEIPESVIEVEAEKKIINWNPESLVPVIEEKERICNPYVTMSTASKNIVLNGKTCLNLGTFNFLNFVGNQEIEEYAVQMIRNYGVGSCGPRGFYGTVDVHLDLEERLAKYMGTQEAIVYAYGFSTIASAIPAYAKRGDVIFVDEKANFAIQKGLVASRSKIKYFKHNNWMDLEVLLQEQAELDKKNPRKARRTRRFLIVEGIYVNTGIVCDLPHLIKLKHQYKLRLFIDESVSFGTLGSGHGITSYFNIPRKEVDLIMANLEYAMGSVGGFCVGSSYVIEHQRLSGLGYCFSASLPPLHAGGAIKALDIMEDNPEIFCQLEDTCNYLDKCLRCMKGLILLGVHSTPVRHLYLCPTLIKDVDPSILIQRMADYCIDNGVAVVSPAYLEREEKFEVVPSLRVCVNRTFSCGEIEDCCKIIQAACDNVLALQQSGNWKEIVYGIPLKSASV